MTSLIAGRGSAHLFGVLLALDLLLQLLALLVALLALGLARILVRLLLLLQPRVVRQLRLRQTVQLILSA